MTIPVTAFTLAELARATNGECNQTDQAQTRFAKVTIDTRALQAGDLFVALPGPNFDGHDYVSYAAEQGASAALVEHPVQTAIPEVVVSNTRKALGEFASAWRNHFDYPVIAITGSNGKTTVKQLTAGIAACHGATLATQGNLNNELGVPLTLLNMREEHRTAVIEMGANHAGEIRYLAQLARPTVGIVTNAAPSHLEGFGDLDGVAHAKGELFENLQDGGTAIINADDNYADLWRDLASPRRVLSFGLHGNADFTVDTETLYVNTDHSRFALQTPDGPVDVTLPLPGEHNVANALAAAAAAWAVGAKREHIAQGLAQVRNVGGRLQVKQSHLGACVVDDTYNANPASLAAALRWAGSLNMPVWLVLGDMRELGAREALLHTEAGRQAREAGVQRLFTLGELSQNATQAFGRGAEHFTDVEALLATLTHALSSGMIVLVKGSRGMRMERVVSALLNGNKTGNQEPSVGAH
ncbi:MAG TPA: UDP-N-acetylmuramoyl-tripeptide--D-alanyl-D-alanine ligase [Gammaproteobacteria bacterium]|nr:UDP-N-acetylmuramoyl-tripeptide--D-alanyl-D-alanine ligase [Gammaproteobacteria bacterium]